MIGTVKLYSIASNYYSPRSAFFFFFGAWESHILHLYHISNIDYLNSM